MNFEVLIPTFLEITSTDDVEAARGYLEMSGGDLDTAVNLFFENGGSRPNMGGGNNGDTGVSGNTDDNDEEMARRLQQEMYQEGANAEVRRPIQPVHEQLVSDYGYGGLFGGAGVPGNSEQAMFGSARRGIFNQTEEDGRRSRFERIESDEEDSEDEDEGVIDLTETHQRRRRRSSDEQTSTQKRLARMFRPPWDIISKLDFDEARKLARKEKKWVLVNIQDVTDFRCQCLNRDFWSSNDIKDLVRENFVFLQYQHDSPNGELYRNLYQFSEYPHIAIIDPWTGERLKMWSSNPEVHKFIEQSVDFMTRFSLDKGTTNPMVKHKQKFNPDAVSEEKQVDMAMKESLGEGGAVETDDVVIIDDEQKSAIKPADEPHELTYAEKLDKIPATDVADPTDASKSTRIQIRSGFNGQRVVKKFSLDDPVQKVFEYAKFHFKDALEGRAFSLKMQRQDLFAELATSVGEAGLKNASVMLDIVDEE